MPKKPKIDNPLVLYEIFRSYDDTPKSPEGQRELVEMLYDQVKAKGGNVATYDAADGRIYRVAENIFNKACKTYEGLTRVEQFILDRLSIIHGRTGDQREAGVERLCIQIENLPDSKISDRVEKAAYQVLRHCLRTEGRRTDDPVPF